MPTSDPLTILLEHNLWATRQVLESCRALSREQFHQAFDMGLGSLHDTLTHVLSAMRGWGAVLAEREDFAPLEQQDRTVDELLALLEEIHADLAANARPQSLDQVLTPSRAGKTYSFTRGGVLTHVTTHGMHHRAQCVNMLRQLGVEPLPDPSVLTWIFTADRDQRAG